MSKLKGKNHKKKKKVIFSCLAFSEQFEGSEGLITEGAGARCLLKDNRESWNHRIIIEPQNFLSLKGPLKVIQSSCPSVNRDIFRQIRLLRAPSHAEGTNSAVSIFKCTTAEQLQQFFPKPLTDDCSHVLIEVGLKEPRARCN